MGEKAEEELLVKGRIGLSWSADGEGGSAPLRQGSTASEPRPEMACSLSSNRPFL